MANEKEIHEYFQSMRKKYRVGYGVPMPEETKKEYDKKIAEYVADEMLDYFEPKRFSESKPQILIQYNLMQDMDKYEFDKKHPNWRKDGGVMDWHDRRSRVLSENDSNVYWLKEYKEILKDDVVRSYKLKECIIKYEGLTPDEFKKVEPVLNKFGGKVVQEIFA